MLRSLVSNEAQKGGGSGGVREAEGAIISEGDSVVGALLELNEGVLKAT